MLIRYLRNAKTGQRNGIVVALSQDKIGWALVHERKHDNVGWFGCGDVWDPEKGKMIAVARAESGRNYIHLIQSGVRVGSRVEKQLLPALLKMRDRATKYFK